MERFKNFEFLTPKLNNIRCSENVHLLYNFNRITLEMPEIIKESQFGYEELKYASINGETIMVCTSKGLYSIFHILTLHIFYSQSVVIGYTTPTL